MGRIGGLKEKSGDYVIWLVDSISSTQRLDWQKIYATAMTHTHPAQIAATVVIERDLLLLPLTFDKLWLLLHWLNAATMSIGGQLGRIKLRKVWATFCGTIATTSSTQFNWWDPRNQTSYSRFLIFSTKPRCRKGQLSYITMELSNS